MMAIKWGLFDGEDEPVEWTLTDNLILGGFIGLLAVLALLKLGIG